MISADIKTDGKQEIKELVAVSYNFYITFLHRSALSKLEIQYRIGLYF